MLDVVRNTKPTILIGVSGQPGLMTEKIIKTMYADCKKPIVFPLSNPNSRVEALPKDIIRWTEGMRLSQPAVHLIQLNIRGNNMLSLNATIVIFFLVLV